MCNYLLCIVNHKIEKPFGISVRAAFKFLLPIPL